MEKKDFFTETLGMSFKEFQKKAHKNSSSGDSSKSASSGNHSTSASSGHKYTSSCDRHESPARSRGH